MRLDMLTKNNNFNYFDVFSNEVFFMATRNFQRNYYTLYIQCNFKNI